MWLDFKPTCFAMKLLLETEEGATYFFLFPQSHFHAFHRDHDVDLLLFDVLHLELILQREDGGSLVVEFPGITSDGNTA